MGRKRKAQTAAAAPPPDTPVPVVLPAAANPPPTRYVWKEGKRLPVPAEVAGAELERITQLGCGVASPAKIVDESEPIAAPLHPIFTWDQEVAARKCRIMEAGQMVRSIQLVREDPAHPGQPTQEKRDVAFISVTVQQHRGYARMTRVMSDAELRLQALRECVGLLRGIQRRYENLTELAAIFGLLDQIDPGQNAG